MRVLAYFLAALLALPVTAVATPSFAQVIAPRAPVQIALDRARSTMVADPVQGLKLAATAEMLARDLPQGRERIVAVATARWLSSEAYLRLNQIALARPIIAQTLTDIASIREPVKLRGDLLLSLGSLQMDDGKAAQALASYQRAFRIFEELKEARGQALAYHYIAGLYLAANDHASAERYYRWAAELYSGDPSLSLTLHNSRGNVLIELERYDEAQHEYELALKTARDQRNAPLEARILGNIARNQVEAGRLDDAAATLARGFALVRDANGLGVRATLLATAARLAYMRGNYGDAARLIRERFAGIDPATTSGDSWTAHLYAYQIFRATGDIQQSLRHLEALRRLSDEANKVATNASTALAAAQFNYANKETQIATMRADQATRAAAFQRTLFMAIGGGALALLLILATALLWIRRSRNQVRDANIVLNRTNDALEKALKAKTEFLATTSHEIRTPLNGILGMTQVMLCDERLDDRVRDRIGVVHGAGMTMRSLVDDILDVAKMETGNLSVEASPMDLVAMSRDVTRIWAEQARAKGLTFQLDVAAAPQWIVSDAARLRQVIFNLLSNAIKFTERGGVSLRVSTEHEAGDARLHLVVTDTGIGIPAEKREEIFESFRQADSGTTRRFGGTGLGLTICRNLARALGGDIGVECGEGGGSVFTVTLPLALAEPPSTATPDHRHGMLVLDRNPIARALLRAVLEPRFGRVRFLATPAETIAALGEGGTTHLLIDEGALKSTSGDVSGALMPLTAAAAAIGARTSILWTAPTGEFQDLFRNSNIDQVIEKPVSGPDLIATILAFKGENSHHGTPGALVSCAA
ncbi:MAG: ATP-binding protein [Sphingomonas sp.]